jgi:hypothetical protein
MKLRHRLLGPLFLVLPIALGGCMSTRLEFSPKWDPSEKATYEDYFDYYFLGFVGDPVVNVQKICMDQKPYGLKRFKSPEDGFLTAITLGIYAPVTVRVWCGD